MADKPRSIFEDVQTSQKPAAAPGAIDRAGGQGARGAIRRWLMVIFALVALMIAVGGMTRLTDSGLSITEWKPVTGAIPPMTAAAWEVEFEKYRAIPEYQLQNAGMTLSEFKAIYWWEWGHRQLGRVIGLVWALGFAWFYLARKIPTGWTRRLLLLGALGGLQGAIGWWMVHSGLQEGMLDVASYRLATHLGLAFVIFGFLAWYVFLLGRREADLMQARRAGESHLFGMSTGLMHFAFLQIILGALVAGIDAGRAFPTWPLMGDGFLPPDPFTLTPLWRNFFEDAGLVQFVHRMVAYGLFAYGIFVWTRARRSPNHRTRFAFNAMLAVMFLQVVLGIVTALYSAPVQIAILHQIGAVALWVLILRARYLARYPLAQSIREGA
ncbi:heme A synthase [Loktanella sp. IMCC34160]|uniref:heme A synthase n=1 Tax=Loktanella sp. IMCC34160 TaxID=2510646 RepID=UPI00101CE658|nr:heme A synthase [Loktanella sp. IMCC34160]RYG91759.1 heme A synthase [Loktanella sp. IMCC34160]